MWVDVEEDVVYFYVLAVIGSCIYAHEVGFGGRWPFWGKSLIIEGKSETSPMRVACGYGAAVEKQGCTVTYGFS